MPEVRSARVNDQTRAIEDWAAYWSAHEMERLLPLFTDDVIYEDVPMGVMNRGARNCGPSLKWSSRAFLT